jgi:hypothetical protein
MKLGMRWCDDHDRGTVVLILDTQLPPVDHRHALIVDIPLTGC